MSHHYYRTITGRKLDLGGLERNEREFLGTVEQKYEGKPEWSEFASWWLEKFQRSGLPPESVAYRICQDLEARLGITQGRVASPDYRDYLADLIEERYVSRYRFCKETGVDPGHLSRVLASRSDLSLESLQRILDGMQATLVIHRNDDLAHRASPERAAQALAAAVATRG